MNNKHLRSQNLGICQEKRGCNKIEIRFHFVILNGVKILEYTS